MVLDKEAIRKKFNILSNGILSPQKRGFEFEKIINSFLVNENLQPKTGYKPKGEQIDGSFFWEGRTFLLEAKWTRLPIPASSIYAFKGKLDGKFHTTSGIFISINGYSNEAEDALKFGKTLNIILFDGSDIKLICNGIVSFLEILKFKLRQAGDTGSLLVPYEIKDQTKIINDKKYEKLFSFKEFVSHHKSSIIKKIDELLIFVEGKSDIEYVNKILKPLSLEYFLSYKIEILDGAYNVRNIPSILNIYGKAKAVIVLLDDDLQSSSYRSLTENISEQISNSLTPIPNKFFFIPQDSKQKFLSENIHITQLRKNPVFNSIENFIQLLSDEFYDPEIDIPMNILFKKTNELKWNYKSGIIEHEDAESGHNIEIKNITELIDYLEECVIQAMNGEMPLSWLKEQEYLDYNIEVREYLNDYHLEGIRKLGWDENEL